MTADWLARFLAAVALLAADAPGGAWIWAPIAAVALVFFVLEGLE